MNFSRSSIRCIALFSLAFISFTLVPADELPNPKPASLSQPLTPEDQTLADVRRLGRQRSRYLKGAFDDQAANASAVPETADLKTFESQIRPLLESRCIDCHGPDTQEASFRIDTLNPDLRNGPDSAWWEEVVGVITKGEMPPADVDSLTDSEQKTLISWLSSELQAASEYRRRSTRHSTFRRLTRYEYNYALQDLLGVDWDFAKDLPPESQSEDGFRNSSELLQLSVSQLETYRRIARHALSRVIVTQSRPKTLHWDISMKEASRREWAKQQTEIQKLKQKHADDAKALAAELKTLQQSFRKVPRTAHFRNLANGRHAPADWNYRRAKYAVAPTAESGSTIHDPNIVAVLPQGMGSRLIFELGDRLPDQGNVLVTAEVSKIEQKNSRVPELELYFGWQASNEGRALIKASPKVVAVAGTNDHPQTVTWEFELSEIYPRNSVRGKSKMGATPSPSEYIRLVNRSASSSMAAIHALQVDAPFFRQWPPARHQQIFAPTDQSQSEEENAAAVVSAFLKRAWRRPGTAGEIERKLALFRDVRPQCGSFEEAMVEVLASVLSSPQFLFVSASEHTGSADQSSPKTAYALATRLALFLWCSIPDDELLELAETGQLLSPDVLQRQVDRMLQDSRSDRLSDQFVRQWLNLELLEFQNIKQRVRGFDPLLKEAMQQEPVELFSEVLKRNHSVLDLIHSDYALLNERLARHYRMQGIRGREFRRVELDGSFRRGGFLTQAGFLTMNSDYPDSHPLKRAVWILERVLADPPPPPPPAVPQIDLADPEIAKMTLKQQIENHRNHAACLSCHSKIDPWGIAFENYDALGRWRTEVNGKPVDASSELFNRQTLNGMQGLKRYLLADRQDQFVRSVVSRLATFALGRSLAFTDRAAIDRITANVRKKGDGLKTIVEAVVTSELFQERESSESVLP